MTEKIINCATAAGTTAGDDIEWKLIVDDRDISPGDATDVHVECTRPAGAGALGGGGLNCGVALFPVSAPPVVVTPAGIDTGNLFAAGETKSVDFHVTNPPAAPAADYWLQATIQWGVDPPHTSPWVHLPG